MVRVIAAATLGCAAAITVAAAPAQAKATYVAIVVAGAGTACASAGGSGLTVLGAHYTVRTGQPPSPYTGFVLTINGKGTTRPDNTHYWSYWHNTGSGWVYSSTGAGSYTPKVGTVEGWSYVNGSSSAPKPPTYSYASICGKLDPKPRVSTHAPPPSHAASTPAPHAVSTTAGRAAHLPASQLATTTTTMTPAGRTASVTVSNGSVSNSAPSGSSGATRTRARLAAPASSGPGSSTPASSSLPVASAVAAPARAMPSAPPVRSTSTSALPALGTAMALVVLLGLGGAAYWRNRRRVE